MVVAVVMVVVMVVVVLRAVVGGGKRSQWCFMSCELTSKASTPSRLSSGLGAEAWALGLPLARIRSSIR